jgi:hypothetical protein
MGLSIGLLLTGPATGWTQPPDLAAATVQASVAIDSNGVFVFRYSVANGARSGAGISRMSIDISVAAGAAKPSAVPVGLSAPQSGWEASIGADATARWVAIKDANVVLPKQTLSGFSITSHGPPSIRSFTLAPRIDRDRAPIMPPGDDPGAGDQYNQEFEHYMASQSIKGVTLAPTALRTVTADAVVATLSSQIAQARSSGWISSDAAARSIRAQLDAAQAALSRRQADTARNILSQLRTEVAAQSGKGLTSEAVTLINVNAQYALRLATTP